MELRQLRYFIEAARQCSISRAAASLHIVQPALTAQIQVLEAELGMTLLQRHSLGVQMTAEGERVKAQAETVLTQAEKLRGLFAQPASEQPAGRPRARRETVRVGLPNSVIAPFAAELIRRTESAHPGIRLEIVEGMSGFVLEWLRSGRIDIGVLFSAQSLSRLDVEELLTEKLALVGKAGALRPGRAIKLDDLPQYPLLISTSKHDLGKVMQQAAAEHKLRLNVVARLDSVTEIKYLVSQGAGYAVLAPLVVREELRQGLLSHCPIRSPSIVRTLVSAVRAKQRNEDSVAAVRAILHTISPEGASGGGPASRTASRA
ncbi:MAG: LysR family transcriptional regulator [Candidatus Protistobacter heckmanni]|nr:LysR family transcriptional regulator [Candidatus Protistobacter heckmanni]